MRSWVRHEVCTLIFLTMTLTTVLVVDDDPPVRRLMASILAEAGYRTLEAESGFEALRIAEAHRIDLLITDLEMPGMSGPELINTLRQRGVVTKSLVVTGNRGPLDHASSGICVLAKPFNAIQLLDKTRAMVQQQATGSPTDLPTP